jgi:hypothetical protein
MFKAMTRIVGGVAAISLGSVLLAGSTTSASADAGSAIAAGLFGGAAGMMFGAAIARPAPVVVYEPALVYVEAPPRPVCHTERRPVFDETGYPAGSRPMRVCY